MGLSTHTFTRRARLAGAGATLLAALVILVGPARTAGAEVGCTRVIGQATAPPAQLAAWFATTGRQPKLDVSVLDLATMFVEEGVREGVRGDIAFAQAIVETGYFGFSPSVPPEMHNYAGIGATGGGVKGHGFPDARSGVRAQIQHLRAYADPSLRSAADLKAPLVDPRFRFLVPNPRTVPCWEQFGNGVWAADPTGYGPRVLSVHQRIAAVPVPAAPPAAAAAAPAPPVAAEAPVHAPAAAAPAAEALVGEVGVGTELSFAATAYPEVQLGGKPVTSTKRGSGLAGAAACVFVGAALISICTTLWWHGRRFSKT